MMPTAKYPNRAKMKRMQHKISVQPLRREKSHVYMCCHKERTGKQRLKVTAHLL